jgi:hypothetical protein
MKTQTSAYAQTAMLQSVLDFVTFTTGSSALLERRSELAAAKGQGHTRHVVPHLY